MASKVGVDRKWQARDDVRTLAEARRIEADSKRLKAAKAEARTMMAEEAKRKADLEAIAKGEQ